MYPKKSALALSIALSSAAFLAVAAEEDHKDVREITVEGQYLSVDRVNSIKTPTPILDVPQSLSIVTADQITELGITSVGDIIDYVPGVNTSQGEGHRDAIVFRGVRSTADFYVDGNRDDVQYYRGLYNVEQVEILRGPNALLFGRGGTGGILNRVSKKAELGEQFTGYKSTLNSYGSFGLEVDTNFATSDTSAVRINAMYEGLENHRDFFDGERIGFNPTVRFELNSDTTLDLSYEYVDHERFVDRGIPTGPDGRPVEALENVVFADPENNETSIEAHTFRAALAHNFSDSLKGNFSAFYGDYDKVYQNLFATNYDPDLNRVELDGYVDETDRQNLILSTNLVAELDRHTIIVGGEYIDTSSDQFRFNTVFDTTNDDREFFLASRPINFSGNTGVNFDGETTNLTFTDLNDDTRVNLEVFSLYIQDHFEITEQFDVLIGARFDSFDIDVFNVPAAENRSRKDEEVSPRLGLIYKPQENISLYASYSETFLPRSGEQFANINGDANQLDPDKFENSEVGLKWDINSTLSLTAAYFENEQTRADRDNLTGEAFEIRGLEVEGFEVELRGQLTEKLSLQGGYSYLDGETASGAEPRELPENMASLWGTYQATDKIGFGLGVTYQDESLISDGGTAVLPSYTRVDVAAYYDVSENLRVQLNVENLTDELYFPNAHSTHQATVGAPLNAMFTVTGKF